MALGAVMSKERLGGPRDWWGRTEPRSGRAAGAVGTRVSASRCWVSEWDTLGARGEVQMLHEPLSHPQSVLQGRRKGYLDFSPTLASFPPIMCFLTLLFLLAQDSHQGSRTHTLLSFQILKPCVVSSRILGFFPFSCPSSDTYWGLRYPS